MSCTVAACTEPPERRAGVAACCADLDGLPVEAPGLAYRPHMEKPSFGERFRYWFDGVMSRGVVALMGLLALASLLFIAAISALVWIFGLYPQPGGRTEELSFP